MTDHIGVEIGLNQNEEPHFRISRWGDDATFSLAGEKSNDGVLELEDGKYKYKSEKHEIHLYDKPDEGEDGGFEFEWVLKEKPQNNTLEARFETKNLEFFYQGELTPDEIAFGASRPENVIGSYAAYFSGKRKRGMEYRTGKAFHIYRPKAIDALGSETWCDLNINKNGKKLTVTVPQSFLDNATYPVTVDPTFGYTSIGGSAFGGSADIGVALRATAPDNGTIDSISCYFGATNVGKFLKGIVYSDAASPIKITDGIGNSIEAAASGWITSTMSTPPTIVSGTVYYIGIVQDAALTGFQYDTGGVSNQMKYGSLTYASPENTWTTPANFDWFLSVYATYTEEATDESNFFF